MNKKFLVAEVFAGCGGMSLGFRRSRYNIFLANEMWQPAINTYVKNHPETIMVGGDITSHKTKKEIMDNLQDVDIDVLIGGPPCQAYSVAGLRNPEDPRGKLFEDYLDMIRQIGPKVFVMENVKGMLSIKCPKEDLTYYQKSKIKKLNKLKKEKIQLMLKRRKSRNSDNIEFTMEDSEKLKLLINEINKKESKMADLYEPILTRIENDLKNLGYKVDHRVLNSAHYGVAQKRERVIIIGTRYNIKIRFPKKTHSDKQEDFLKYKNIKPYVSVKEAINDLKNLGESVSFSHVFSKHSEEFIEKIRKTKNGNSLFGLFSNSFFKVYPDKPSNTVKENHGGVFLHYEKDRVMTPRELARLQSFPDSFKFEGSKKDVLVQIGNAVPPKMSLAIAKSTRKMLMDIENIYHKLYKRQEISISL